MEESYLTLSNEAAELYLDSKIPHLETAPSPLEFMRNWVHPNKPVLIHNAITHWPALEKWNSAYLRSSIGNEDVTVTVTPNGLADAVCNGKFVMPEERTMPFSKVLDILEKKIHSNGIFYVQKQNSNFTDEFHKLMLDSEPHIPWATEALGMKPDAVNFWIGDERAVTSMHKDHYENLYCVVSGTKTFILLPPTDQPWIPYGRYQAAKYQENCDGNFDVVDDNEVGMVPWISVDPLAVNYDLYPGYKHTHPIEITVNKGDMLYLPSLWYHHVRHTQGCIAVNYWYDMQYDIKYNYYKFVEKLLTTKS